MARYKIDDIHFSSDSEGVLDRMTFGNYSVRATPHYHFAMGFFKNDKSMYDAYKQFQEERGKDVEFKIEKFEKLCRDIRRKGLKNPVKIRGLEIVDGHHRAAIWAALGHKEIECKS